MGDRNEYDSFDDAQRDIRQRIDPQLGEALSTRQKNERAGISFVNEVRGPDGEDVSECEKHDVETVHVEFGLLYGDETFTQEFVRPRYEKKHPDTPLQIIQGECLGA